METTEDILKTLELYIADLLSGKIEQAGLLDLEQFADGKYSKLMVTQEQQQQLRYLVGVCDGIYLERSCKGDPKKPVFEL